MKVLVSIIISLVFLAEQGVLATILVREEFTRTDNAAVRNTAASPVAGPSNWTGSNGFTVTSNRLHSATTGSGHVLSIDFGTGYFDTNPGIYILTADVYFGPDLSSSTQSWQIGFNNAVNTSAGANRSLLSTDAYGGAPGVALQGNGRLINKVVNTANQTQSAVGAYPAENLYTLKLVLNTLGANWTTDAYINSTQIDLNGTDPGYTYTYSTNPTIRYVTIASTITTANRDYAYLDNFELTVIPEPGFTGLVCVGAALLRLGLRRKSR